MHKKYGKDGLAAITVNLDLAEDSPPPQEKVLKFLRAQGANFTNLRLDEPSDLWEKKLRFTSSPCYYVFSRQGKWTMFQPEEAEIDQKAVEKLVVQLLAEK